MEIQVDHFRDSPPQHFFRFQNFLIQVEGASVPFHLAAEGQQLTNKLGRPLNGFLNPQQLLMPGVSCGFIPKKQLSICFFRHA